MMDMNYELENAQTIPINEQVIFPNASGESMGMEDVRFVKFEDELKHVIMDITAYNGKQIRTQLIETKDFKQYRVQTLNGPAVSDKGMALFPEKVNGKFVMISRQGEKILILCFPMTSTTGKNLAYSWSRVLPGSFFNWEIADRRSKRKRDGYCLPMEWVPCGSM
jgi:predicted GH43/DUF377 family glycosyl hydrolase